MTDDILPIGSIVTVDNQDLMICAYLKKGVKINNDNFDYICCLYPTGIGKDSILIKKVDIKTVKFIGFQDNRFVELKNKMRNEHE